MTLCVCGHVSADHAQMDEGEYCRFCAGTCLGYRKTARPIDQTVCLSAGVTPEGLAGETVSESVNDSSLLEWGRHLIEDD